MLDQSRAYFMGLLGHQKNGIAHCFAFPVSDKPIQLKVLFEPFTGEHLYETPLTANQSLTAHQDGRILLQASIAEPRHYVGD